MKSLLLFAAAALLFAGAEAGPINVTYIDNDGFLIQRGHKTVLIDALFDLRPHRVQPSGDIVDRMTEGRHPFRAVDLVLVTHSDLDHFSPRLSVAYLRDHPRTQFVALAALVDRMKAEAGFAGVSERVNAVSCKPGERRSVTLGGIKVDMLCLDHGHAPDKPADRMNVAYVVDLDGARFLHTGDSNIAQNAATFEAYPFAEKRIDLLFLNCFDSFDATRTFIAERMKPGSTVLMHLSYSTPEDVKEARAMYPSAFLFEKALQQHVFGLR